MKWSSKKMWVFQRRRIESHPRFLRMVKMWSYFLSQNIKRIKNQYISFLFRHEYLRSVSYFKQCSYDWDVGCKRDYKMVGMIQITSEFDWRNLIENMITIFLITIILCDIKVMKKQSAYFNIHIFFSFIHIIRFTLEYFFMFCI